MPRRSPLAQHPPHTHTHIHTSDLMDMMQRPSCVASSGVTMVPFMLQSPSAPTPGDWLRLSQQNLIVTQLFLSSSFNLSWEHFLRKSFA